MSTFGSKCRKFGSYGREIHLVTMDIRAAEERDILNIVGLLKLSLGETLMPKSEQYWRWKHLDNPFGQSPVLLCYEGDQLIGVRAFMRWQWRSGDKIFHALRAVDTATHPEHQGKGIFKKLTLALVEHCKANGDHFVFNTPNEQSKPGYLKMGWRVAGTLPVRFRLIRPMHIALNVLGKRRSVLPPIFEGAIDNLFDEPQLSSLIAAWQSGANGIKTDVTLEYLRWRYRDVPVAQYHAIEHRIGNDLRGVLIGRFKVSALGLEFRVTNCFYKDKTALQELMKVAVAKGRTCNLDYITWAASESLGFGWRLAIGPIVTVRSLVMDDLTSLIRFNSWDPTLGDLELF